MQLLILLSLSIAVIASPKGSTKHGKLQERVVGGQSVTNPGQYPHQVSIQWNINGYWYHICGGAIISPTWVVTAAHCKNSNGRRIRIIAGVIHLSDDNYQSSHVDGFIVHPEYERGTESYDIALARLLTPLTFTSTVRAIGLPQAGSIPSGYAEISGWGSTSRTDKRYTPDNLQYAFLPLLSLDDCKNAVIKITGNTESLDDNNICSGALDGSAGVCTGDSGGPLIQGNQLIGVASWGFLPCGSSGAPNVFTRVSAANDFIYAYVNDLP